MATKKVTKKTNDSTLVVNLVDATDSKSVYLAFGLAKIANLSKGEIGALKEHFIDEYFNDVTTAILDAYANEIAAQTEEHEEEASAEEPAKKPGMLKRFWNWVTRKK